MKRLMRLSLNPSKRKPWRLWPKLPNPPLPSALPCSATCKNSIAGWNWQSLVSLVISTFLWGKTVCMSAQCIFRSCRYSLFGLFVTKQIQNIAQISLNTNKKLFAPCLTQLSILKKTVYVFVECTWRSGLHLWCIPENKRKDYKTAGRDTTRLRASQVPPVRAGNHQQQTEQATGSLLGLPSKVQHFCPITLHLSSWQHKSFADLWAKITFFPHIPTGPSILMWSLCLWQAVSPQGLVSEPSPGWRYH